MVNVSGQPLPWPLPEAVRGIRLLMVFDATRWRQTPLSFLLSLTCVGGKAILLSAFPKGGASFGAG
jgi:hypothetical protein